MSTLAEVRRYRWPELTAGEQFTGKEDDYNHRRDYVLASDYDALQAECEGLKQAIRAAKPAIELGAGKLDWSWSYVGKVGNSPFATQLRALMEIVK